MYTHMSSPLSLITHSCKQLTCISNSTIASSFFYFLLELTLILDSRFLASANTPTHPLSFLMTMTCLSLVSGLCGFTRQEAVGKTLGMLQGPGGHTHTPRTHPTPPPFLSLDTHTIITHTYTISAHTFKHTLSAHTLIGQAHSQHTFSLMLLPSVSPHLTSHHSHLHTTRHILYNLISSLL